MKIRTFIMKFEDKNSNIVTETLDAEDFPAAREIVKKMGAIKILKEEVYKNFNQGVNEYEVSYFSGVFQKITIFANSKEHAAEICKKYCEAKAHNIIDKNEKIEKIKHNEKTLSASDAEDYLYEMDMSGVDSITLKEGFNQTTTITRNDVFKALPHLNKY